MRNSRRAMSFIEIMIVVVILGVLVGVAAPTMKGLHRRNRLAAVVREFAALARYARNQSILIGHTTEIRINEDMNKYRLYLNPPGLDRGVRSSRKQDQTEMEYSRHLDEKRGRITFKSVVSAGNDDERRRSVVSIIRFFRNGSATPATLVIANSEERSVTIQIAGATGAVRINPKPTEKKTETEEDDEG